MDIVGLHHSIFILMSGSVHSVFIQCFNFMKVSVCAHRLLE